jgi:hypothetical protein
MEEVKWSIKDRGVVTRTVGIPDDEPLATGIDEPSIGSNVFGVTWRSEQEGLYVVKRATGWIYGKSYGLITDGDVVSIGKDYGKPRK